MLHLFHFVHYVLNGCFPTATLMVTSQTLLKVSDLPTLPDCSHSNIYSEFIFVAQNDVMSDT